MEQFKIELGHKESNGELPRFRAATLEDSKAARSTVQKIFRNDTEREIYEAITVLPVVTQDIEGNPGELSSALKELSLKEPEEVFIFFPRDKGLDEIDVVCFKDLDNHLDYYWYPSQDDMVVLSSDPTWCLYISHFGTLHCVV